jgi:hypothetical protein
MSERGFKRKTIINIIDEKINDWLKSIKDESLKEEIRNNYIVTGGAIPSMLLGEMPNDFDVYFSNFDTAQKVVDYYLKQIEEHNTSEKISTIKSERTSTGIKAIIKSAGVATGGETTEEYQYFEAFSVDEINKYFNYYFKRKKKKDYEIDLISSNAISLVGNIQIITRFVGPVETIHENYDFEHCKNYYSKESGLVLLPSSLECILTKELKYSGSKYPICSLFRIKKFIQRGWTINAGQIFKIAWDINNLELSDTEVLEEQLLGVDAAYFHEILRILKEGEKDGKPLDRTYLFEAVNRVFDGEEDEPR